MDWWNHFLESHLRTFFFEDNDLEIAHFSLLVHLENDLFSLLVHLHTAHSGANA